jgi:hypothetical protein
MTKLNYVPVLRIGSVLDRIRPLRIDLYRHGTYGVRIFLISAKFTHFLHYAKVF